MRVFVLGGYGLIGSYVVASLIRSGHQVVGLTRSPSAALRLPTVEWHDGDLAKLTSPGDWRDLLKGIEAVVNCAGALQNNGTDSLEAVHVAGPSALFQACLDTGVQRVIHISSVGIDSGTTHFARTKSETEKALKRCNFDWVILRPGLVIAPAAFGGTALIRGLAGFPWRTPIPKYDSVIQVVSVHDVAETVRFALGGEAPCRVTWDLVHPDRTTLADVVTAFRAWLGFPSCPIWPIPVSLARLVSLAADAISFLGWRSPLRSTALSQLVSGVQGNPETWMRQTTIAPLSLAETLSTHSAGVQDRWFARSYFVKPIGLALLAAFWICTGLIALGPGFDHAAQILDMTQLPRVAIQPFIILGALLDIGLGLAVAIKKLARIALMGMLATCGTYLIAGSVLQPDLWFDPLGPLTKIFPIVLAVTAVLALMDER